MEEVKKRMRWTQRHPGVPQMEDWVDRPELADVISAAAEALEVDPASWTPGRRSASTERALVVSLCVRRYGYRGKELADALGYRSSSSVQTALARVDGSPKLARASKSLARAVRKRLEDC